MRVLITILCMLFILSGCKKANDRKCFKSIGDIVVESRDLEAFSAVVIDDHIDLVLTEDVQNRALVETGENLLNFIVTEVRADTLFIRDDNKCSFLRDLSYKSKVHLNTATLKYISANGSGDLISTGTISRNLTVDGFHANGKVELELNCDSAAFIVNVGITELNLTGNVDYAYFYYFGNGNADATQLVCTDVLINWQSTGWLKLYASNALYGNISSTGNVYYSGNPAIVDVGLLNTGQLIPE